MDERDAFAVVEFEDDFQLVKTEWCIFENNAMVASYFPPKKPTKIEYMELLKQTFNNVDTNTYGAKKTANRIGL